MEVEFNMGGTYEFEHLFWSVGRVNKFSAVWYLDIGEYLLAKKRVKFLFYCSLPSF